MPPDNVSWRLKKAASIPRADEDLPIVSPSKETLEQVRALFKQYAKEVEGNVELSQSSKTMYVDFADCFVRWMRGGFKPGSRGSNRRKLTERVWPGRID